MSTTSSRHGDPAHKSNEASRLDAPPEIDFLIPRKPVSDFSVQSPRTKTGSLPSYGASKAERPNNTRHFPTWLRDWWLEILCCALFVAAMMAVVGTVLPYQDQPLPQWPYNVSINTLISILAAITKAAMLLVIAEGLSQLKWTWFRRTRPLQDMARYDMASRGPWRSFRFLLSSRGGDLITSVGAVVTVASIAIDPFAQQLVRYEPCIFWTQSPQASLPRTNAYLERGGQIYAGIGLLPAGMQASINAGIFTPGETNVTFNCPTGNCTFTQEYSSLAFCSSCVDSTTNISISFMNSTGYDLYNYSLPSGLSSTANNDTGSSANNTMFVMQANDVEGWGTTIEMITNPWGNEANMTGCPAPNNDFGCNGVGAATCALFPCIKTYTGSIENGYLTETLKSNWTQFDQGLYALDVDCLDPASRQAVIAQHHPIGSTTKWIAYNTSLDQTTLPNGTYVNNSPILEQVLSGNCMYEFYWYSASSLNYFMLSYFTGNVTTPGGAVDAPVASSDVVQYIWNSITNGSSIAQPGDDPPLQNITNVFSSVADAMTAHIRQNGDANHSVPVLGIIGQENTCVHVYWGWLAYPFSLILITLIFFVTMMIRTATGSQQNRFHGWKSSPLALIYHGLDQDTMAQHDQGTSMVDMKHDAEDLYVRLSRTDRGWKLAKS